MSHVPQALPLPKASVDPLATPHIAIANQERYLLAERFTDTSYAARLTYRIRGRLDRRSAGGSDHRDVRRPSDPAQPLHRPRHGLQCQH